MEPKLSGAPEGTVYPLPLSNSASFTDMVAMSDGVRLATDIYLPAGRGSEQYPVLLTRTPYGRGSSLSHASLPIIAKFLTARGYAIVVQDVRGKGHSEGERYPNVNEARDGYDTIEWIARQSWSNGAVGMFGPSYLGFTQWAAASAQPPALKCIAPRSMAVNVDYPLRDQGVPWMEDGRWFIDSWAFPEFVRDDAWDWGFPLLDSVPDYLAAGREILRDHVCGQTDRAYHLGRIFPNGNPTDNIKIPALHVGAWWDGYARGQVEDWRRARQAPAGDHQYLYMRAADHFVDFDPTVLPGAPPGTDDSGYWMNDDELVKQLPIIMEAELAFFDYYLRGVGDPPQRVRYQVANDRWRTADSWPPREASPLRLYLTKADQAGSSVDGGGLSAEPQPKRSRGAWIHDPANPVPSLLEWEWAPLAAPPDETEAHRRLDVMTFTGSALPEPLRLVGPATVKVLIGTSGPSTHVVATLSEVDAEGRARLIAHGASHVTRRADGDAVAIDLGMLGYQMAAGSRIRVAISSSSFPRYVVHPGTDANLWLARRLEKASQWLEVGGPHGSALFLSELKA